MTRSPDDPILITFSGLDGSGKTTQIEHLCGLLAQLGLSARVLAFWDDVVVFSRHREGFVHQVLGSERGVGAPGKPVQRRDKNVRRWHLTFARHLLYLADALHLRLVLRRARRSARVIVMDRYLYDELANLPLTNLLGRAVVRFLLALVPRPDVAYLLDADPDDARARKPEYPVAFLRDYRRAYLDLAALAGMTVIPPLPLGDAQQAVASAFRTSVQPPAADTLRAA